MGKNATKTILLFFLLCVGAMECSDTGCATPADWQKPGAKLPIMGDESLMSKKAHGTSEVPAMQELRWGVAHKLADRICNFNRHYAEPSGRFLKTQWLKEVDREAVTEYCDSNTGKVLFKAPVGRSFDAFLKESRAHGWPSFRDAEVDWTNVRVLKDGEVVSLAGTHLGHNIPDRHGNRYCINLCSVAGEKRE